MNENEMKVNPETGETIKEEATLSEALGDVRHSLMRVASSVMKLPMSALPEDSRGHFNRAGSEFSKGLSSLLRSLADGMEGRDEDKEKPTRG